MKYYIVLTQSQAAQQTHAIIRSLAEMDREASFRGVIDLETVNQLDEKDVLFQSTHQLFGEGERRQLFVTSNIFNLICKDLDAYFPDVLILIGYHTVSFSLAKWAAKQKIRVVFCTPENYLPWEEVPVLKYQKYISALICAYPQEQARYRDTLEDRVHFTGHPLLDRLSQVREKKRETGHSLCLFIGQDAISHTLSWLPQLLKLQEKLTDYELSVHLPNQTAAIQKLAKKYPQVNWEFGGDTQFLLQDGVAVIAGQTTSLLAGLLGIKQIFIERLSWGDYMRNFFHKNRLYHNILNWIAGSFLVQEWVFPTLSVGKLAEQIRVLSTKEIDCNSIHGAVGQKGYTHHAARVIFLQGLLHKTE